MFFPWRHTSLQVPWTHDSSSLYSNPSEARLLSPPRVDRTILDKLRSLDTEGYVADTLTHQPRHPTVTRLPSEGPQYQGSLDPLRDPTVDVELCGTSPCRLLLPTFISEQESKARKHLLQISHLARALNRTLVLPNVGRSRMSSCSKWDFGYYYELSDFREQVTFSEFRRWVALRAIRPKAQVVEVLTARRESENDGDFVFFESPDSIGLEYTEVTISQSSDPAKMSHNHCLRGRASNLQFGDFSPVYIYPYSIRHAPAPRGERLFGFGRGVIATLSSTLVASASTRIKETKALVTPDVLLLSWEMRHPVFPLASDNVLVYANRWTRIAETLSARLQPFAAVHWRMEQVPVSSLSSCVPLLINSITSLLKQHTMAGEIESIYFATDYPTEGPDKPHSGTFHVEEGHHRVMQLFETSFAKHKELKGVRLTGLVKELQIGGLMHEGFSPDDLDSGLMGVIDKMVSARSSLFISGGLKCGKISSFTKQIIDERKHARSLEYSSLLNTVEYFG